MDEQPALPLLSSLYEQLTQALELVHFQRFQLANLLDEIVIAGDGPSNLVPSREKICGDLDQVRKSLLNSDAKLEVLRLTRTNATLQKENRELRSELLHTKTKVAPTLADLILSISTTHQNAELVCFRSQQLASELVTAQHHLPNPSLLSSSVCHAQNISTDISSLSSQLDHNHQELVRLGTQFQYSRDDTPARKRSKVDISVRHEQLVKRVLAFMERTSIKQHAFARKVGCSQGTLSCWLKFKYSGDVSRVTARIEAALDVLESVCPQYLPFLAIPAAGTEGEPVRRKNFTHDQVAVMEKIALSSPCPSSDVIAELSAAFARESRHIGKWFSNWRSRKGHKLGMVGTQSKGGKVRRRTEDGSEMVTGCELVGVDSRGVGAGVQDGEKSEVCLDDSDVGKVCLDGQDESQLCFESLLQEPQELLHDLSCEGGVLSGPPRPCVYVPNDALAWCQTNAVCGGASNHGIS